MNAVAEQIVTLQNSVSYWFNKGDQYRADECERELETYVETLDSEQFVDAAANLR